MGCTPPSPSLSPTYFLREILCVLKKGINVVLGGGSEQAITVTNYTANTSVAAGATSIEIHPSADFVGTVGGQAYSGADWSVIGPFNASPGNTLGALAITRSAGSYKVIRIA